MMKGTLKRFTALLAVMMLVMSAGAAMAADAPKKTEFPTALKVLESGGAIGYEASARFDPAMLKNLLLMGMGGDPGDEAASTMVDNIFAALNKLTLRGVYAKNEASGVLGTDKGEVVNFQFAVNEETMDSAITTNLMPDVALRLDPAMLKSVLAQPSNITFEQLQEMLIPYGGVLTGFFAAQVGPQPEKAATPYDIDGVGQFHYLANYDITSLEIAELLEKLLDLFKGDKRLQSMMQQAPSAGEKSLEESLKEKEDSIAEIKKAPETVLLTGSVYMNEAGDSSYYVLDTPETSDSKVHITALTLGKGLNIGDVKVKVLVKNARPTEPQAEATDEPAAPAPVDWAALEAEILSGTNFQDVLATVDTRVKPGENTIATATKASVVVSGMNIIIEAEASSRLDKLEGDSSLKVYLGGKDPLVTLAMKLFESIDKPVLPVVEGRNIVTLKTDAKGELTASDVEKVKLSLKNGLPLLMENLNKALPEEGPALVALITNALTPPQIVEQEEEPEEAEEAEEEEAPVEPEASGNP